MLGKLWPIELQVWRYIVIKQNIREDILKLRVFGCLLKFDFEGCFYEGQKMLGIADAQLFRGHFYFYFLNLVKELFVVVDFPGPMLFIFKQVGHHVRHRYDVVPSWQSPAFECIMATEELVSSENTCLFGLNVLSIFVAPPLRYTEVNQDQFWAL